MVVAIESLKVFPYPRFLARREVGQAEGGLVARGALSVGGLQRGRRWPRVWHVGPSRRAFCRGAGNLDYSEIVHCGVFAGWSVVGWKVKAGQRRPASGDFDQSRTRIHNAGHGSRGALSSGAGDVSMLRELQELYPEGKRPSRSQGHGLAVRSPYHNLEVCRLEPVQQTHVGESISGQRSQGKREH